MSGSAGVLIDLVKDVTVVKFNQASIVDAAEATRIGKQLDVLVDDQAPKKIVLDFSQVRALSSSALGVLIRLRQRIAEIEGHVLVCGLGRELKTTFQIAKLDKLFACCEDRHKALAALESV